jgi:hypothetical protein
VHALPSMGERAGIIGCEEEKDARLENAVFDGVIALRMRAGVRWGE